MGGQDRSAGNLSTTCQLCFKASPREKGASDKPQQETNAWTRTPVSEMESTF